MKKEQKEHLYCVGECHVIGQDVRHNEGGFYHKMLYFYRFEFPEADIFIIVESDTRDFTSEKREYVLYKDYILLELEEWEKVIFKEIVEY